MRISDLNIKTANGNGLTYCDKSPPVLVAMRADGLERIWGRSELDWLYSSAEIELHIFGQDLVLFVPRFGDAILKLDFQTLSISNIAELHRDELCFEGFGHERWIEFDTGVIFSHESGIVAFSKDGRLLHRESFEGVRSSPSKVGSTLVYSEFANLVELDTKPIFANSGESN